MKSVCYLIAILAGLASPVQAGGTATLYRAIHRPFEVGAVSAAGTVLVTLIGMLLVRRLPDASAARAAPWWAWCSGAFGTVFIVAQPLVGAKIGAGSYVALVVTAATVASIVIDHRGWLRFPRRRATALRIGGCLLMVAGVGFVAAS